MIALAGSVALFGSIGIVTGVWQQTVDVLRPAAGVSSQRRSLLSVGEAAEEPRWGPSSSSSSSSSFHHKKKKQKHPSFYSVVPADGEVLEGGEEDDDAPDEHPECADSSAVFFSNITDGNDT